jgi:hypothetical protein
MVQPSPGSSHFSTIYATTTSYLDKNPTFDPTADKYYHTATITQLLPASSYRYYVTSLDDPSARTEVYHFTTQPMPVTTSGGAFNLTYIVYGDMGVINSGNTVSSVTQAIRRNQPHVDFIFHIGGP